MKIDKLLNKLEEGILTEETIIMKLFSDINMKDTEMKNEVFFTGEVNTKKVKKISLDKLPKPFIDKLIKAMTYDGVNNKKELEEYIIKQSKPIRFVVLGNKLRMISNGRTLIKCQCQIWNYDIKHNLKELVNI